MIRPVDAPIGQRFGENPTGNLPFNDPTIEQFGNYQPDGHSGEDYKCGLGSPVRAVTSGTVLHVGWMGGTYADNPWWIAPNFAGYCAVIDHGSFIGIYGHCQDGSARVRKGERVAEGQVFILSGNTGGSTGPHLHFEILPDGYVLNSSFYGRIDPEPIFGGITPQGTITTMEEGFLMALTEDEQRRILAAADMALDTPGRPTPARLLNSADGGYIVALLEALSGKVGATLTKEDGGYIVGLVSALRPGSHDADAIASAVIAALPGDLASQVADKIKITVTAGDTK